MNGVTVTATRQRLAVPIVLMAGRVLLEIIHSCGRRRPETGGVLLGPIGSNEVTEFHFDETGSTTSVTYSPDHVGLMRLMKSKWQPAGIDMKGFVHSHPGDCDGLSHGDLAYVHRLLESNDDMDQFLAPIVLPETNRIRPFVIQRSDPWNPQEALIVLR